MERDAVVTPTGTRDGDRITVRVAVTLRGLILACDEAILDALNQAGATATGEAVKRLASDGTRPEFHGESWFSEGHRTKCYKTPYGAIATRRRTPSVCGVARFTAR